MTSGILLWTSDPLRRKLGLPRRYEKEEHKGRIPVSGEEEGKLGSLFR
jgi:hypothetical protein